MSAALDIMYQIAHPLERPPSPRQGLPALKLFQHIRAPEIPYGSWSDLAPVGDFPALA
jgi:hypothetical protein